MICSSRLFGCGFEWMIYTASTTYIKVGDHAQIGANAVVTKDVDDKCVMVGVPARCIKKID